MVTELNTFGAYIDTKGAEVDANAESAERDAITAANSAALASFKGLWSSLSGSLAKPASVLHNNSYWALLNNLTNVASSEPSGSNPNWAVISSELWTVNVTSSVAIGLNTKALATAIGGDITLTPPVMFAGAYLIVNNSPLSDSLVKVKIPAGMTVYSNYGSVSGGDNITLIAGDTLHIAADSETSARTV